MKRSKHLFIFALTLSLISVGSAASEGGETPVDNDEAKEKYGEELNDVNNTLQVCRGKSTPQQILNDLFDKESRLDSAGAKKHMMVAKRHLEVGIECAKGAQEDSQQAQKSCLTIQNFKEASFPEDEKFRKNKFQRMACRHLYAVERAEKRAEQAYNHIQGEMKWQTGVATQTYEDKAGEAAGLIGLTSKFINEEGLGQELLKSCPSDQKYLDNVVAEFNNSSEGYPPRIIKEPQYCIEGGSSEDGAVFYNANNSGARNMSFFTRFLQGSDDIGQLNQARLCYDHIRNNCLPIIAYKAKCSKGLVDENAIDICEADAHASLINCANGNYEKAKYPEKIISEPDFDMDKILTKEETSGETGIPEIEYTVNQDALVSINDTNLFNKFFDKTYGTCVYMRAAAEKAAEDAGTSSGLMVGEVIQGGRYSCKRVAPWTADFNDCAFKMLYGDGLFDAAAVFGGAGIQVKSVMDQGSVAKKQTAEMAAGNPTAGLNAQKSHLKNQAENQYIQGGMSGSHAIALTSSAAGFPTPDKLSTACSEPISKSHFKDATINCGVAVVVDRNPGLATEVFANQEVKEALYYKGAEKLMESALATLTGLQLDKQAKDIKKIKDEYDKFFQQDVAMPTYEPVNYCEKNPNAPSCSGGNRIEDSTGGFGDIGFQNSGGGNFSFNNGVADGYNPDESLTEAEKEARDRLGDIISSSGKKGNNDFDKVGEASGSSASKVSGGGGGGGAGGGGGGSTAAAPKKAESNTANNFGMQKSKTQRSEGGSVNYRGGGNIAKNRKKNAFDGLLDRSRRRDVATTTEDIAPVQSKLFEKISKRYNQVSADKRLYEFESEQ